MNTKRFALSCIAVYIVYHVLGFLLHATVMAESYAPLFGTVFRPEAEVNQRMWIIFVTSLVWAVIFCYVFTRGYEGRGLMEGVRYGLIIGLFFGIPFAYESYVLYPLPYAVALHWFLSSVAVCVILGIVLAAVYKPQG